MDSSFLDANVLFSAAYRSDAGLRKLWRLPGVRIVSSAYAVEEARRNLSQPRNIESWMSCSAASRSFPLLPLQITCYSRGWSCLTKTGPYYSLRSVWGRRTSLPATFGTTWGLTVVREYKGF